MEFKSIDKLKKALDSKCPLPSSVVKNLRDVYLVEWTYNSNAIEGNTLTLLETKVVIEDGLAIGGKQLKEHFEVINHVEAINYVENLVAKNEDLTEFTIKDVHRLVTKNILDDAGRYRKANVLISGSQHRPPDHTRLSELMGNFMNWYQENKNTLHPVELAGQVHFKFVYIHPFSDGNGRTARLLMNFILMGAGYPPAIIKAKTEKRLRYYESLEKGTKGDVNDFINIVADYVSDSLKEYLSMF